MTMMFAEEIALRDKFASDAMKGILASWHRGGIGRIFDVKEIASDAYAIANAMLQESKGYRSRIA